MDAILISARRNMVDVDDARRHLADHKELWWTVGFPIVKSRFSFPIFGFIHITGGQVEYRTTINDIVPFLRTHYYDPAIKPESWRLEWQASVSERREHRWKNNLV